MWEAIKDIPHFYDRLGLMPGAKNMFDTLYNRYGDKCEILTAIPKPLRQIAGAAEDKKNWVKRLLSEDLVVNTKNVFVKINRISDHEDGPIWLSF